jgi:signal peptidase I
VTCALPAAAILLTGGLLTAGLVLRRVFLVTTVDGSSMEPTLRSGDRLLVRRTQYPRAGQVVVFRYPDFLKAKAPPDERSGLYLIKRAVAVPGDQLSPDWGWPDLRNISGQTVPPGSFVVLGDNREASFDSRTEGYVVRERLLGVMIRHMVGPAGQARDLGSATARATSARVRPARHR